MPRTTAEGHLVAPLFDVDERVPAIQEAVDELNEMDSFNMNRYEDFTVDDWFEYRVEEWEHGLGDEDEYAHIIDCSDVPDEHDGWLYPSVMRKLMKRNYFIGNISISDETFLVSHMDLIRRRMERYEYGEFNPND